MPPFSLLLIPELFIKPDPPPASSLDSPDQTSESEKTFTAALRLVSPWQITQTAFQAAERQLRLYVDFKKGAIFPCPSCQLGGGKVRDTVEKE